MCKANETDFKHLTLDHFIGLVRQLIKCKILIHLPSLFLDQQTENEILVFLLWEGCF